MSTSKDCWTQVAARSSKKTMTGGGRNSPKSPPGFIRAYPSQSPTNQSPRSMGRSLDPEEFPALPKRIVESTTRVESPRCWRKKEEESRQSATSRQGLFTADAIYPCLVQTVNAVLEKEDALPKTPGSEAQSSLLVASPGEETKLKATETEQGWKFEVVPGLSFVYSIVDAINGENFLERNAYRLFFGEKFQSRPHSRYAFAW